MDFKQRDVIVQPEDQEAARILLSMLNSSESDSGFEHVVTANTDPSTKNDTESTAETEAEGTASVTSTQTLSDHKLQQNRDKEDEKRRLLREKRSLQQWLRRHGRQEGTYPEAKDLRYTVEHNNFIIKCHEEYARAHNGRKIPLKVLVLKFNKKFPNMQRTKGGLSSHISRNLQC